MLKLTARAGKRNSLSHCVATVNINGAFVGWLRVETEQADELVELLNGATDMREALRLMPPSKLMDLANWFELEKAERPGWTMGEDVQQDLRRAAQLSLNALAKAKGGTE